MTAKEINNILQSKGWDNCAAEPLLNTIREIAFILKDYEDESNRLGSNMETLDYAMFLCRIEQALEDLAELED